MRYIVQKLIGPLVCLAVIVAAQQSDAQTLEIAIDNLAKDIEAYLDEKRETQVTVDKFIGPSASTAGRAIQAKLQDKLKAVEITILPLGAKWTIRGEYLFEKQRRGAVVLIKAKLVDQAGKEITEFRERVETQEIKDPEDITKLLGTTIDLREEQGDTASDDGDATENKNNSSGSQTLVSKTDPSAVPEKVTEKVNDPTFSFLDSNKSTIAAEDSSPFRVEVLVKKPGQASYEPLPLNNAGGFAFAPLQEQDLYAVRIHNTANHAVGVKVSIDGINSFALSEIDEFHKRGTWFVGANSTGTISGWYINPQTLKAFLVTAKGQDFNLPDALELGTITVQFFHAWREGEPAPAIEREALDRGQLRTVPGPDIQRQTRTTRSFFGKKLLASISIRYSNPDDLPPPE